MWLDEQSDEFVDSHPTWSVAQLVLAAFCCLSLTAFVKIQECFYFGSGWALMGFVLFMLLLGWPVLYIQIRLGNQYQRGILGLFKKFFPFSFGFGLAMIIRNVISVIYISSVMTHCLSYIFFSVYPCDKRYCVGAAYMWGSCEDEWNRKIECRPELAKTQQGPTPEEGFYLYYNMDISGTIADLWFPRWFLLDGLNAVPHLLNWLFIFLTVVWGPKLLGILLYALAPIALILFLVPFGVILANCPRDLDQLSVYWQRFYRNFAATIPLNKLAWDTYEFSPVPWGLLATFVHLAASSHLWRGVWPSIGSWVPRGRKTMQLSFLPVLLLFGLLVQLPTILAVVCYASAYDMDYLRCHVAHSYALPFTLIPHILSKFSLNRAVGVCYYLALYLFLLLSQAILMVASADAIVDYLRQRYASIERRTVRTYRLMTGLSCPIMFALSFPFIIKSGYWWLRLFDTFMDRLEVLIVTGAGVAFFVAYYRTKATSLIPRLLFLICLGLAVLASIGVYIWHAATVNTEPAISACYYQRPNRDVDPMPGRFTVVGWLLAVGPPVLGFFIGLAAVACGGSSDGGGGGGSTCRRLFYGDFLPEEDQLAEQRKQQQMAAVSTQRQPYPYRHQQDQQQQQQQYQLQSRPVTSTGTMQSTVWRPGQSSNI